MPRTDLNRRVGQRFATLNHGVITLMRRADATVLVPDEALDMRPETELQDDEDQDEPFVLMDARRAVQLRDVNNAADYQRNTGSLRRQYIRRPLKVVRRRSR